MRRARAGLPIVLLCLAVASSAASEPEIRTVDAENVSEVSDLLLDSARRWIARGDLVLRVGTLRYEPNWDDHFLEASKGNLGRFTLDEEGTLQDRESGERPAYTFGLPFPEIDPADPKAGAKVMWNRWFTVHKRTQIRFPLRIHVVGRSGVLRVNEVRFDTLAYDGREGGPLQNRDRTEWRELVEFVSPTYVAGTTSLTWRFLDERPDSVWVYLPLVRRVRKVSSTNRSDALAGTDVTLDDGLVWSGKNQSFEWKLLGERELLVPTATLGPQPLHPGREWENGREWVTGEDYRGVRWGFDVDGWEGAPWAPVEHFWVKRPVWVVEGHSKDRYYAYGRQLFYVDKETFHAYAKEIDTPAGESWKTVLTDMGMTCAPKGQRCYPIVSFLLTVDDKNDRATATTVAHPERPVRVNTPALRPEEFSVGGLLPRGK